MHFVIVNGFTFKPMSVFCSFCHLQLEKNYVKDLQTGVVYHNVQCMAFHRKQTQEAIEHHA